MINYTYNEAHRPFFVAAYQILVAEAGAQPDDSESFVLSFTQVEHPTTEYRFQGVLGFGGKFWRNAGRFYVTCYSEDETKKTKAIIDRVNVRLKVLAEEFATRWTP